MDRLPIDTTVVKRFRISPETGYSAFWRRDRSPVPQLELTKLLHSIRKIASYIGRNTGDIVWSGMQRDHGIAIDPSPFMGRYPLPPHSVDILVGIAAHEALAATEWRDYCKEVAIESVSLPDHYAYKFLAYLDMCERVYIDCVSNRSVLGRYTEKARERLIHDAGKEWIEPPTLTELLHIWWRAGADRSGTKYKDPYVDRSAGGLTSRTSLEKFYKEPVAILNSIVPQLIHDSPKIRGVADRCRARAELYCEIWPSILQVVKFWPTGRDDPFLLHDNLDPELETEAEERDAVKATLLSYVEHVERSIRTRNPDFTADVRANVQNVDEVVSVEGNDIIIKEEPRVDRKVEHELQIILQRAAHREFTRIRGLVEGKLDRRRLYRVSTNGRVFQRKKSKLKLPDDFVLLVDATGSMAEPSKWAATQTVWMTLASALHRYCPNLKVYAYNEVRETCRITEIFIADGFYSVLPHGKTASAEAIIATGLRLRQKLRRLYIVHITDGASNWGCGIESAISFCKKNRIKLATFGMSCPPSAKQSLRAEYGSAVEFMDDIRALPRLARSLLIGKQA